MKKITIIIALLAIGLFTNAQDVLYNNGSILQVNTGCILQVNGNLTNIVTSTLTNNGTVTVTGNSTNNQVMATPNTGTLEFKGTTAQTLNGTATFFAKDVLVNNAAGITLNTTLKVDGIATFTNGNIVAAIATPIIFTTNGTVSGANDNSHVVGYVIKEGTGSFTYPVGDGTKYQKCNVNLTANATGMQVKYNATDAGTGTFTTTGTEPTALIAYNALEHWDITPLSTAAGTVTMYWDAYNNGSITDVSHLKCAHKVAGNWLNEGTTGIGTISAGSVTSNAISSWSPFALGSINNLSTLPLHWLNVSGNINTQKQAIIKWQVQENNVANYQVEKSTDGRYFTAVGTLTSKGNGENTYSFIDIQVVNNVAYYKIKQTDVDGRNSYSRVIKLNSNNAASTINIYPNPVKDIVTISGATIGTKASIIDVNGRVLQTIFVTQNSFTVVMSAYSSGVYFLKMDNGTVQKIIKQ